MTFLDRMTFFRQNDKRTYCLMTDYIFRQNDVFRQNDKRTYCLLTDYNFRQNDVFRQNDKRTYCLMTYFETQDLEHWTLKLNDTKRKGN